MRKEPLSGLLATTVVGTMAFTAGPAAADPAIGGSGSAFGGTITLAGEDLLPPTPLAEVTGTGDAVRDAEETTVEIPASPIAFNQTLSAEAHVHQNADLTAFLSEHTIAGPFNGQALGQVENLEVLIDAVDAGVPLVNADLITGEVVAQCVGTTVQYSADSEIVDLDVAGAEEIGDALDDLLATLFPGLDPLDPIVNVETGVVTTLENGLAIDALVVTVLDAALPGTGVVQARFGHAELSGVTCGQPPACSDTADNDGDGKIDTQDPGCHTDGDPTNPDTYNPNDDDESDGPCADQVDNDTDGTTDFDDADCHTDGNPANPDTYDPNRDETTRRAAPGGTPRAAGPGLARTGPTAPTGAAVVLIGMALGLATLRRRAAVSS